MSHCMLFRRLLLFYDQSCVLFFLLWWKQDVISIQCIWKCQSMKGTLCIVLMCLKKNVTQCYTSTYNILVLYNTLICRLHKYSTNANKKCTYVSKQYISTDHAVIILTFFSHSKNAITVLYSSIIYSVFLKFTYV